MNNQSLNSICSQVYKRFPEVKGSSPKVQSHGEGQYLVIFKGAARTADGKSMPRIIRVVVEENGKILKMTSSR